MQPISRVPHIVYCRLRSRGGNGSGRVEKQAGVWRWQPHLGRLAHCGVRRLARGSGTNLVWHLLSCCVVTMGVSGQVNKHLDMR